MPAPKMTGSPAPAASIRVPAFSGETFPNAAIVAA